MFILSIFYPFDKSLNVCFVWRYIAIKSLLFKFFVDKVSLYRTLYHTRRTINKLLYVKSLYLFGDIKIFFATQLTYIYMKVKMWENKTNAWYTLKVVESNELLKSMNFCLPKFLSCLSNFCSNWSDVCLFKITIRYCPLAKTRGNYIARNYKMMT